MDWWLTVCEEELNVVWVGWVWWHCWEAMSMWSWMYNSKHEVHFARPVD